MMCRIASVWVLLLFAVVIAEDIEDIETNPLSLCLSTTAASSSPLTSAAALTTTPSSSATTAPPDGVDGAQRDAVTPPWMPDWPCNTTADVDQFIGEPLVPVCGQRLRLLSSASDALRLCLVAVNATRNCWVLMEDARKATTSFYDLIRKKREALTTLFLGCGADVEKCNTLNGFISAERSLFADFSSDLNVTLAKSPRLLPGGCNMTFIPAFLLEPNWHWKCYNISLRRLQIGNGDCGCVNYGTAARNVYAKYTELLDAKLDAIRKVLGWSNCSCSECQEVVNVSLTSDLRETQDIRLQFARDVLQVRLSWESAGLLLAVTAVTVITCTVIFFVAACVWRAILAQLVTWMLLMVFCAAALWLSGTAVSIVGYGGTGQTHVELYYALNRAAVLGELAATTIFFIMWIDAIFGVVFDSPKAALAVKAGIAIWSILLAVLGSTFVYLKLKYEDLYDIFFTVLYGSLVLECTAMAVMALAGRAQLKDERARRALGRMTIAITILWVSFVMRLAFTVRYELLLNQGGIYPLYVNLGIAVPMSLSFFVLLVVICITYYKGRTSATRSEIALAERRRQTTENLLPLDHDSEHSSEYDSELAYRSAFGDKIPAAYDI